MTEERTFSMPYEVGVVVRDLKKVAGYYQSLGIGPFESLEKFPMEREVRGKPAPDVKLDIMKANLGPFGFNLVQPVAGKGIEKEFLDTKGEGVNYLGFVVDDVEEEVAKMSQRGIQVISNGKYPDPSGKYPVGLTFAYFDTCQVGGIYFEVVKNSPGQIPHPPAKKKRTTFSRPCQVALVVKDMGKAVEYYQALGIGPFSNDVGRVCRDRVVRGRPTLDVRLDVRQAYIGPWSFELMQPAEDTKGESIQAEILNTWGEGFIHICFLVDNLEKELVQLSKKGFKVLSSGKYPDETGKYPDGPTFVYLDTRQIGGVILELVQARPERMQKWETLFPGW
jgi:catechol 2,3-dioxygenase-like lactoylglutathione lyase family enzyme